MGTRAVYTFKETKGSDANEAYHVYKHSDGYPEGAQEFIEKAFTRAWPWPRYEPDEFAAGFIAANKEASGDLRLCTSKPWENFDVEYWYVIYKHFDKLWVDAYTVNWWESAPVNTPIYSGEVRGLASST